MKVTVITVCFNSAATIGHTLESVARQSHPDIEHIVIDGASSDNTVDIVRRFGSRVTQLVSEPDVGIYDAMNKGIRLATGDIVGFLNADDAFAHDGVLAAIVQAAAQLPAADVVYGDLTYVRGDGSGTVVRHWRSGDFSPGKLRWGWMPPHPTFYVSASRLAGVGLFDPRLRIAADYDFMLRCLTEGKPGGKRGEKTGEGTVARYLPQVLVHMRTGGASNRSLKALLAKSREDLSVLRRSGVGGWLSLVCKNVRKVPQFLGSG